MPTWAQWALGIGCALAVAFALALARIAGDAEERDEADVRTWRAGASGRWSA